MDRDDQAARRFWALQIIRLSGLVMVLLGAMAIAGTVDLPEIAGAALLFAGAFDFFAFPVLLARKWKSDE